MGTLFTVALCSGMALPFVGVFAAIASGLKLKRQVDGGRAAFEAITREREKDAQALIAQLRGRLQGQ
jgi:hypothetical protein